MKVRLKIESQQIKTTSSTTDRLEYQEKIKKVSQTNAPHIKYRLESLSPNLDCWCPFHDSHCTSAAAVFPRLFIVLLHYIS